MASNSKSIFFCALIIWPEPKNFPELDCFCFTYCRASECAAICNLDHGHTWLHLAKKIVMALSSAMHVRAWGVLRSVLWQLAVLLSQCNVSSGSAGHICLSMNAWTVCRNGCSKTSFAYLRCWFILLFSTATLSVDTDLCSSIRPGLHSTYPSEEYFFFFFYWFQELVLHSSSHEDVPTDRLKLG